MSSFIATDAQTRKVTWQADEQGNTASSTHMLCFVAECHVQMHCVWRTIVSELLTECKCLWVESCVCWWCV